MRRSGSNRISVVGLKKSIHVTTFSVVDGTIAEKSSTPDMLSITGGKFTENGGFEDMVEEMLPKVSLEHEKVLLRASPTSWTFPNAAEVVVEEKVSWGNLIARNRAQQCHTIEQK